MKKLWVLVMLVCFLATAGSSYSERGNFWDYDAGPAKDSEILKIIAETPNYRAVGKTSIGNGRSEKFRWKFGPMFGRGRWNGPVEVLIIGQEGAQDENMSDRSFTGGTGGRMQHVLNYLGVESNYLFLNTFIYTIRGQYSAYVPVLLNGKLRKTVFIEDGMYRLSQFDPKYQDAPSPIVAHRHRLLDEVIRLNKDTLKLIIAVGAAAKDTVTSYALAKGGYCEASNSEDDIELIKYSSEHAGGNARNYFAVDKNGKEVKENDPNFFDKIVKYKKGEGYWTIRQFGNRVDTCKASSIGLGTKIKVFGVPHPGSGGQAKGDAARAKALEGLQQAFQNQLDKVARWYREDPSWLQYNIYGRSLEFGKRLPKIADNGKKFEEKFRYGHSPIPFKDFKFGINQRLGSGGTTTNRQDKGDSIQIYSGADGYGTHVFYRINPRHDNIKPPSYYTSVKYDLPYEPPKKNYTDFDEGPGEYFSKLFMDGWEEFSNKKAVISHYAIGPGAIYRGRPNDARVLIIADQKSYDFILTGRALTGYMGQKMQSFLEQIGIKDKYVVIKTMPYDILGSSNKDKEDLFYATREKRNKILRAVIGNSKNKSKLSLVITLGSFAKLAGQDIDYLLEEREIPYVNIEKGTAFGKAFQEIKTMGFLNDKRFTEIQPAKKYSSELIPINRKDLPFGTRRWVGTSGNRVGRAKDDDKKGKFYKYYAPKWATDTRKTLKPINKEEVEALKDAGFDL